VPVSPVRSRADWGALSTMLVQSAGLSQPHELSGFSVDASGLVDSPVEKGRPDWTVSNSREYLLAGIANAVPQTTRQRAGRQAESVVGVGPPGPANTTTRLPAGPAAHNPFPVSRPERTHGDPRPSDPRCSRRCRHHPGHRVPTLPAWRRIVY
jgi:hypothetical protein